MARRDEPITLFRQSATGWPGGPMVHVLDRRHGFMLAAPSPCHAVLAAILAETATMDRDSLVIRDRSELEHRGYCRHCIGTLA